jgi:hypothetical protein
MLLNVGVEAVAGAVPVLGDLFDAAFKANARNVALLRREMDLPGSTRRSSKSVVGAVIVALVGILGGIGILAFLAARALWNLVT